MMKRLLTISLLALFFVSAGILSAQIQKAAVAEPDATTAMQASSAATTPTSEIFELPKVIPPSPQSQIFEQYVNHPITEYNGLPEISIPLYEIEIKGMKIPITLTYHASGVQYLQHDGEVGAGWSISAGGYRITRTVKGKDDFENKLYDEGVLQTIGRAGNMYRYDEYLAQVACYGGCYFGSLERLDGEYDMFTYMTPSTNGHFIISDRANKKITSIEQKNDKILYTLAGPMANKWSLTDENGFQYYFGGSDIDMERTDVSDPSLLFTPTAWALKTICSPYNDSVQFEYKQYKYRNSRIPKTSGSEVRYSNLTVTPACVAESLRDGCPDPADASVDFGQHTNNMWLYTQSPYLTSIKGAKENIQFKRIDKNVNNSPCLISEIVVTDSYGRTIKKIDLTYSVGPNNADTTTNKNPWHILLASVKIGNGNKIEKEYKLDYYLPFLHISQASPDYWNYYSAKNNGHRFFFPASFASQVICTYMPGMGNYTARFSTIGQAYVHSPISFIDRNADQQFASAFSLKKITYPTGGWTEYEYELNQYYDDDKQQAVNGVGQRIKKITSYSDASSSPLVKEFKYGYNEDGLGEPNCKITDEHFVKTTTHLSFSSLIEPGLCFYVALCDSKMFYNTIAGTLPYDAFSVYYPEVSTYQYDSSATDKCGKIVSRYTIPKVYDDVQTAYLSWYAPGLKPTLINRRVYNNKNSPLQEEVYSYTRTLEQQFKNLYAEQVVSIDGADGTNPWSYSNWNNAYSYITSFHNEIWYNISTGTDLPASKTTTLYTNDGSVVKREEYSYNHHNQLEKKTETTSTGGVLETEYRYPADGSPLAQRNMYATVLEEIIRNNGQELKRVRNSYPSNLASTLPLPESVDVSLTGEAGLKRELTYNRYDNKGNLLQYTGRDGVPVSFLWGYNGQYPIVKVVGASYAQVDSTLGSATMSAISGYQRYDQLSPVFSRLRSGLSKALVSGCTYYPLIGMATETSPSGMLTTYRYDIFGRLLKVLDNDQHVVKQYAYHYAGKNDIPNIELPDSHDPMWVETGNFRCQSIEMDDDAGSGYSGKYEYEFKDLNPLTNPGGQSEWRVKAEDSGTHPSACPATYTFWINEGIPNKQYFIHPVRSYNDGKNPTYRVRMNYRIATQYGGTRSSGSYLYTIPFNAYTPTKGEKYEFYPQDDCYAPMDPGDHFELMELYLEEITGL